MRAHLRRSLGEAIRSTEVQDGDCDPDRQRARRAEIVRTLRGACTSARLLLLQLIVFRGTINCSTARAAVKVGIKSIAIIGYEDATALAHSSVDRDRIRTRRPARTCHLSRRRTYSPNRSLRAATRITHRTLTMSTGACSSPATEDLRSCDGSPWEYQVRSCN